jgi:hypothetical protein
MSGIGEKGRGQSLVIDIRSGQSSTWNSLMPPKQKQKSKEKSLTNEGK